MPDGDSVLPRSGPRHFLQSIRSSAYFVDTGRLDSFAVWPEHPGLVERGRIDGQGDAYVRMHKRGELLQMGTWTSDIEGLLREAVSRWGHPESVTIDRWRDTALREAMDKVSFPPVPIVIRGQGHKDGSEDLRIFMRMILDGDVVPVESLLMRSAFAQARTLSDPAGNLKLAKSTQAGRKLRRSRDDSV